jgi:tetratricopeptide (TPR) repeat protein
MPQPKPPVLAPGNGPSVPPGAQAPPALQPPQGPAKPDTQSKPKGAEAVPDLDALLDRLRTAKTEKDASIVNGMIELDMLQSGSDTIDLLMYRALTAVHNQDTSLAMDLLDSVIALKPDYAEGWNKRATLYFMKRDYGKAISDVEMVLRLQPRHYPALIGLANMLIELGDKKHALEALKRVLLIYPTNSAVIKEVEDLQSEAAGHAL